MLKALAKEVVDCPRLFTITPRARSVSRMLSITTDAYDLTLWCEHPGHWHAWKPATYQLQKPKDLFVTIAPYLNLVFKTLRLAVPVVTAGMSLGLSPTDALSERQLELMKAVVDTLPSGSTGSVSFSTPSGITTGEGQALRSIRQILLEQDPYRQFGNLRRVQGPDGDFLWVCPNHHSEYDPGLPHIP